MKRRPKMRWMYNYNDLGTQDKFQVKEQDPILENNSNHTQGCDALRLWQAIAKSEMAKFDSDWCKSISKRS